MKHVLPVRAQAKNIEISKETLFYAEPPGRSTHLFVVEYKNGKLELHIAPVINHIDIVDARHLPVEHIVGGGNFCILEQNGEYVCYLGGVSGDFKAIPCEVLSQFEHDIMSILEQKYVPCSIFFVDKNRYSLQNFWI